jgi:hypothetical protein
MSERLRDAVELCMYIPRSRVVEDSERWSWELCWVIFRNNLISLKRA